MNNQENIRVVEKWFKACWTKEGYSPGTLRELAAENIVFRYPLQGEKHGIENVIVTLETLRASFPDLHFDVEGEIISDGKYVVGKWIGGGTHKGAAFCDNPFGITIPAQSGRKMRYAGTTIFVVENGKIHSEIGQEEALEAALQLGLVMPSK